MILVMAHYILIRVAHIDRGLEYFHPLTRELRTAQATDKFLGLARKHRATHHLYPPRAMRLSINILCHNWLQSY
jgi:hypothetical protein